MEATTIKICVTDTVKVREGVTALRAVAPLVLGMYQPEFVFTMPEDVTWAPARSRAPSVIIDFDLIEAA